MEPEGEAVHFEYIYQLRKDKLLFMARTDGRQRRRPGLREVRPSLFARGAREVRRDGDRAAVEGLRAYRGWGDDGGHGRA